jgi:hypothetical protein
VEQELPTLPEHLSSPPVFSGVRVTRSLVLYVCFVERCLSACTFFLLALLFSVQIFFYFSLQCMYIGYILNQQIELIGAARWCNG